MRMLRIFFQTKSWPSLLLVVIPKNATETRDAGFYVLLLVQSHQWGAMTATCCRCCFSLQMRGYKCEEDAMVGEVTVQIIYLDTWSWVAATTLATRMMLLPILVYHMKETALLNAETQFVGWCLSPAFTHWRELMKSVGSCDS